MKIRRLSKKQIDICHLCNKKRILEYYISEKDKNDYIWSGPACLDCTMVEAI